MGSLRYTPDATAGIYLISRGQAAEVTAAIRALQRVPLPYEATAEPSGKPNTYLLTVAGYNITYDRHRAASVQESPIGFCNHGA